MNRTFRAPRRLGPMMTTRCSDRRMEPRPVRHSPHRRARLRLGIHLLVAVCCGLWWGTGAGVLTVCHGQGAAQDVLLLTPTSQGEFPLAQTGVVLEVPYAAVDVPTHLVVVRHGAERYTIAARDEMGVPLIRFEQPLIVHIPASVDGQIVQFASGDVLPTTTAYADGYASVLLGWPGDLQLHIPDTAYADDAGRWLVVFDANGVYALPAWAAMPESALLVGPLEHFSPDLLEPAPERFSASQPVLRTILKQTGDAVLELPTAARTARYRARFAPDDLGNIGGWALLGWTGGPGVIDLARALRGTIPDDPDIPAPGMETQAPQALALPFDCATDWQVTWGYHHSNPQNRFAVDFAPLQGAFSAIYAAHDGVLAFKRYGTAAQMLDVGLSARVTASDGVTSTVYGHLDPSSLAMWEFAADSLPDYAWVTVGPVTAGQHIAVMGETGYATGQHLHFALWSWDQSLYPPVPLGPVSEFPRGLIISAETRQVCPE